MRLLLPVPLHCCWIVKQPIGFKLEAVDLVVHVGVVPE